MEVNATPPEAAAARYAEQGVAALTRARSALVMDHPFFAMLALRLRFKKDNSCRDLWTDGRSLGFNPVYAATLPEKKLVGALAHEVLHLAFGHHVRRKGRDETLWNRACDYAINLVLLETGFSLPDGFAHDPSFAGLAVDDIYLRLAQLRDDTDGLGGGAQDAPGAVAGASGRQDRADGLETEAGNREAGASRDHSDDDARTERREARSGKAAPQRRDRSGKSKNDVAAEFTGEVRDHPGLDGAADSAAQKAAEQEADIALSQAMQRALNMGSLPAGLTRLIKRTLVPALDWRELLRRFLEDCADSDYSWTTPNRRYLHQDIYLPSRREPRIPHMALAVDCSGSVDEHALALFCAELSALLRDWDTTLSVLFHDTKVQSLATFGRSDLPLTLNPVGGGGTDYRPVCARIDEEQLRPACLIWFTDMQCNRFPEEPPYPVLWISTLPCDAPPPFGEVICLVRSGAAA